MTTITTPIVARITITPEYIAKLNALKALSEQVLESGVKHPIALQGMAFELAEGIMELTDGRLSPPPVEPEVRLIREEQNIDNIRQNLYAGADVVADMYQ